MIFTIKNCIYITLLVFFTAESKSIKLINRDNDHDKYDILIY